MGNIRTSGLLTLASAASVLIAVVAVVLYINRGSDDTGKNDLDKYFLRDAATVEAMGLPVYWLGREFTAGDMRFVGPYVSPVGAEVEGGGVSADYLSWAEGEAEPYDGLNIDLQLTTYSRDAWSLVEGQITNPRVPRRTVSIQDREGQLVYEYSSSDRPLNALWLIVDFGDVVVVADAHSGGPATPGGADYSPFINAPDLLVQVMQDLRPYPQ